MFYLVHLKANPRLNLCQYLKVGWRQLHQPFFFVSSSRPEIAAAVALALWARQQQRREVIPESSLEN
jgi:hypothetical protein